MVSELSVDEFKLFKGRFCKVVFQDSIDPTKEYRVFKGTIKVIGRKFVHIESTYGTLFAVDMELVKKIQEVGKDVR